MIKVTDEQKLQIVCTTIAVNQAMEEIKAKFTGDEDEFSKAVKEEFPMVIHKLKLTNIIKEIVEVETDNDSADLPMFTLDVLDAWGNIINLTYYVIECKENNETYLIPFDLVYVKQLHDEELEEADRDRLSNISVIDIMLTMVTDGLI